MLTIKQDRTPGLYTSPGQRREQALEAQGIADAMAGRPMASEHPAYGETYEAAALAREVEAGRVAVAVALGARCVVCGGSATSAVQGLVRCFCATFNPQSVEPGMFVMHGAGSTGEDAVFQSSERLRHLTDDGVAVLTAEGVDMTHRARLLH